MLPLYAGLSAGFAHAGASGMGAFLLGIIAFLLVVMLGQIATQLLPSRTSRIAITLLFAGPAAIAGFQVASALLHLSGIGPWDVTVALAMALVTGTATANWHGTAPRT